MPELPEVEVTRQSFADRIRGARVEAVRLGKPLRWPLGCEPDSLRAQVVGEVARRGKYLWLEVERGGLLMHLGMSGSLAFSSAPALPGPHNHFDLVTTHGTLRLTDPRRFGEAFLIDDADLPLRFSRLGVEPLSEDFTPEELGRVAAGRTAPLKSFLLDQSAIAGVGNIYADEALYRARLHPLSPAGSMKPEHWLALRDGIVAALEAAIDAGGSSIDDYRDGRGEKGSMQERFLVHTREGEPCPSGEGEVVRIVVAGRSTYFCPGCQVRLRRKPRRRRPARRAK